MALAAAPSAETPPSEAGSDGAYRPAAGGGRALREVQLWNLRSHDLLQQVARQIAAMDDLSSDDDEAEGGGGGQPAPARRASSGMPSCQNSPPRPPAVPEAPLAGPLPASAEVSSASASSPASLSSIPEDDPPSWQGEAAADLAALAGRAQWSPVPSTAVHQAAPLLPCPDAVPGGRLLRISFVAAGEEGTSPKKQRQPDLVETEAAMENDALQVSREERRRARRHRQQQLAELQALSQKLRYHKLAQRGEALPTAILADAEFQREVQRFLHLSEEFHQEKVAEARRRHRPLPADATSPAAPRSVATVKVSPHQDPLLPASIPGASEHPASCPPTGHSAVKESDTGLPTGVMDVYQRLYHRGVAERRRHNAWAQQERDRLEEERRAAEGCTFRPAITAFAHALPGDHVVPPRPLPPPSADRELAECRFFPAIDPLSDRLAAAQRECPPPAEVYARLHCDGLARQRRHRAVAEGDADPAWAATGLPTAEVANDEAPAPQRVIAGEPVPRGPDRPPPAAGSVAGRLLAGVGPSDAPPVAPTRTRSARDAGPGPAPAPPGSPPAPPADPALAAVFAALDGHRRGGLCLPDVHALLLGVAAGQRAMPTVTLGDGRTLGLGAIISEVLPLLSTQRRLSRRGFARAISRLGGLRCLRSDAAPPAQVAPCPQGPSPASQPPPAAAAPLSRLPGRGEPRPADPSPPATGPKAERRSHHPDPGYAHGSATAARPLDRGRVAPGPAPPPAGRLAGLGRPLREPPRQRRPREMQPPEYPANPVPPPAPASAPCTVGQDGSPPRAGLALRRSRSTAGRPRIPRVGYSARRAASQRVRSGSPRGPG